MNDNSKEDNNSQISTQEGGEDKDNLQEEINQEEINQEEINQEDISKLHETEPLPNSDEDEAADELSDEDDALEEGALERILLKMGVVGELLLLFVKGDRWWMAPLVLLLCVLGAVLVVLNSLEYVAPFIYMAF